MESSCDGCRGQDGLWNVPADVFGEDYLYFYENFLDDELSDAQAELLWKTLRLTEGSEVLDVPCGHGRIANRLAARGARVAGLDADPFFLERARADAAERGVEVEYVQGDMRELPWAERFDAVVNWFTSFGYFDDEGNKAWLESARRTLKPGGRLAIDVHSRDVFMRNRMPAAVSERDGDLIVDRFRLRRRDGPRGDGALDRPRTGASGRRSTPSASTPSRSCAPCCWTSASRPSRPSATTGSR